MSSSRKKLLVLEELEDLGDGDIALGLQLAVVFNQNWPQVFASTCGGPSPMSLSPRSSLYI